MVVFNNYKEVTNSGILFYLNELTSLIPYFDYTCLTRESYLSSLRSSIKPVINISVYE